MLSEQIEYFTRPEMPGEFFQCKPMSASLSVTACAAMWRKANDNGVVVQPGERLYRCYRCEVGASHAGEQVIATSALYGSKICARCNRGAMRLIHDYLCVSCYNRQREVMIGKNGRGTPPIKHPPLEVRRILFQCDNETSLRTFPRTVDPVEMYVSILRQTHGRVLFGFMGAVYVG